MLISVTTSLAFLWVVIVKPVFDNLKNLSDVQAADLHQSLKIKTPEFRWTCQSCKCLF